jgi:hypothetical protein
MAHLHSSVSTAAPPAISEANVWRHGANNAPASRRGISYHAEKPGFESERSEVALWLFLVSSVLLSMKFFSCCEDFLRP